MKVVALLPMKAHSSRVPGKNFKIMCGKPLFQWILDAVLAVPQVERVVINTDARAELAAAGLDQTPEVLIRDRIAALCGDDVSMNLVLQDDIEAIGPGHYLMTHTTNPAITAATIERAVGVYEAGLADGMDSLFSVNRHQTRFYTGDGKPVNHDPDDLIPTQDLPPWYEENSCLYLGAQ